MELTHLAVISTLVLNFFVSLSSGSLYFNEINSDGPSPRGNNQFIELRNPDCNANMYWMSLPGTYILCVEAGRLWDDIHAVPVPVVRTLWNLTALPVELKQEYITICMGFECDARLVDLETWHVYHTRRRHHERNAYMYKGNKYPMVLFLIETNDHESVADLLTPHDAYHVLQQDKFTTQKMDFVKRYMTDVVIYGKRTPVQGCRWIESLIQELKPVHTDVIDFSVAYVNRECDYEEPDLSLNRCHLASAYVLAIPSPGQPNNCDRHVTFLLQPDDSVLRWLLLHLDRFKKMEWYVDDDDQECYASWYSKLYFTMSVDAIAEQRRKMINGYYRNSTGIPSANSNDLGGDDPFCVSPDKKKLKPNLCEQDPKIVSDVEEKCIVEVIKTRTDISFFPTLTDCPDKNTDSGKLLPLSDFDDGDVESDVADGMSSGTYSTADLLMSRSGFFEGNVHNLRLTKICKYHSNLYGNYFKEYLMGRSGILRGKRDRKNIIKCIMPHLGAIENHHLPVPVQRNLFLSKQQSEAIFRMFSVLVPVGLPVCRQHFNAAAAFVTDAANIEKAITPDQALHQYQLRDRTQMCYAGSSQSSGSSQGSSQGVPVTCRADSGQSFSSQEKCASRSETPLEKSRRLLKVAFGNENLLSWWHYTDIYPFLSKETKNRYVNAYKSASEILLTSLAGIDWDELDRDIKASQKHNWDMGEETLYAILEQTNMLYNAVDSRDDRYLILGIVALNVPYRVISEVISGVTHYTFEQSRSIARYYISMKEGPPKPVKLKPTDEVKVVFFLAYIIDNSTPKPWGSKLKKLSCGQKIELPAFLSNIRPKKLITEFWNYAIQSLHPETYDKMLFKSNSTYYNILSKLPLEYRSSATGLDYKTNAGLEAFDTISEILCQLKEMEFINDEVLSKFIFDLNESKRYIRSDFKYHLAPTSTVPDHDIHFALSDRSDKRLQAPFEKDHSNRCQRCELLKLVLNKIKTLIDESDVKPRKKKQLMTHDINKAINDINEWKNHRLRSVHQNKAKTTILQNLLPSQAFITSDFAQKWLPTSGREDQTSYFGKKGISWHINHVVMKASDGSFKYKVYQHMFMKQVAQDSTVVMACLNDTLQRLHDDYGVTGVFLRSDNAGSYHSAKTMAAVAALNEDLPIKVLRWDFSEPQDGKGPADTAASAGKRHIRTYVAENHKATNAEELATAANSDGGVRGVTTIVVHDYTTENAPDYAQPKIRGIQSLNNFEFSSSPSDDHHMFMWRAFGIGSGIPHTFKRNTYDMSWINRDTAKVLQPHEPGFITIQKNVKKRCVAYFPEEDVSGGPSAAGDADISHSDDGPSCLRFFRCPEQGCIRTFNKVQNLHNHIALGQHKYHRQAETLTDCVLQSYSSMAIDKETQEALARIPDQLHKYMQSHSDSEELQMGFALRKPSSRKEFSGEQREYLKNKFKEGEDKKSKFDPRLLAKEMREIFEPRDCLSWQQIASFFSAFGRKQRQEAIANENAEIQFDDDGNVLAAPDNLYTSDPNVGTDEDEIKSAVRRIMEDGEI